MRVKGYISEVFKSIQGEGPWAGRLEVFIRFQGCSLKCPWCDTKYSWGKKEFFKLNNKKIKNPTSQKEIIDLIKKINKGKRTWVTITGGEPFEQFDFLVSLVKGLNSEGYLVHLETNGIHYELIKEVKNIISRISMDWKLPSLLGKDVRASHKKFIKELRNTSIEKAVKVVISKSVKLEEVAQPLKEVKNFIPDAYFVIQPMREPKRKVPKKDVLEYAIELGWYFNKRFKNVIVLPQIHSIFGLK